MQKNFFKAAIVEEQITGLEHRFALHRCVACSLIFMKQFTSRLLNCKVYVINVTVMKKFLLFRHFSTVIDAVMDKYNNNFIRFGRYLWHLLLYTVA